MDVNPPNIPTYRVFRDQHGIPQFDPRRGSQSLKDALIYAFPTLETELQLMQAALKKFFDSEHGIHFVCELPENDLQASLAKRKEPEVSSLRGSVKSWKAALGQQRSSRAPSRSRASSIVSSRASSRVSSCMSSRPDTPTPPQETFVDVFGGTMTTWSLSNGQDIEKRKRQRYDPAKRRRVAENRGNACERHRASKTTCNPDSCPENKLYGKVAGGAQGNMINIVGEVPEQTSAISMSSSEKLSFDIGGQKERIMISLGSFSVQDGFKATSPINDNLVAQSNGYLETETMNPEMCVLHTCETCTCEESFDYGNSRYAKARAKEAQGGQTIRTSEPSGLVFSTTQSHNSLRKEEQDFPGLSIENVLNYNEDPFMGWASKDASHTFDDYGWVLSQVENL